MSTVTFLSDSTAAFFVIRGEPRGLLPTASVENHYRKCNHAQCNHVPTKQNLADTATRDIAAGDLTANSEWIQGPEFLWGDCAEWPVEDVSASNYPKAGVELKRKEKCSTRASWWDCLSILPSILAWADFHGPEPGYCAFDITYAIEMTSIGAVDDGRAERGRTSLDHNATVSRWRFMLCQVGAQFLAAVVLRTSTHSWWRKFFMLH